MAGRRKILLLLPARRLWPWHDRLAAKLAASHDLVVAKVDSPSYPPTIRLRRPTAARSQAVPADEFDLIIDLSERAAAPPGRVLRPHYDGSADSLALIGRLQRGECPLLDIVEGGAIVASSYAATGGGARLEERLDVVFARVEAILLRALAGRAMPLSDRPSRAPAAFSPALRLKDAARRLAGRMVAPLRRSRGYWHWNVALLRADDPAALADFDPAAYRPLQVDPEVFYADPFVAERGGRHYLFAEACPYATGKGVIVCAEVADGSPGPFRTVLERPWHLSYPYVFDLGGQTYLMPESGARGGVDIFRAIDFPDRWELERTLLEKVPLVDSTLFEHQGRLWLLAGVGTPGGSDWDELFAWHAPALEGPWTAHARNPIKSDCRSARPGGRPLRIGGRLIRPAQRCEQAYGEALVWLEISELTPDSFEEAVAAEWRMDGQGRSGPHCADLAGALRALDFRTVISA